MSYSFRTQRAKLLVPLLAILAACPVTLFAQTPAWWGNHGVLSATPSDDYAAVNQGQAKNIAVQARLYFNSILPGGAGSAIDSLIASWLAAPASGVTREDYAILTQGQLKALVQPFYDRLIQVGYATAYPWTASTADDESYSVTNIGQLKNLFSFDLASTSLANDTDQDGLPDWWERYYFGNLTSTSSADPDGDGLTNLDEFTYNLNPTANDYGRNSTAQVFTYDNASRLTGAATTITESFSLDAESNLSNQ